MKMRYLIMVSLVLAIITIGAVSAADDSDNLTAEIDTVDEISQVSDVDVTSDTGEDALSNEDPRWNAYYEIVTPEKVKPGETSIGEYHEVAKNNTYITFYSSDLKGNLSILVDGNEKYNTSSPEYYVPICLDLASLNLEYGLHNVTFLYSGDSQYKPFTENRTFEYYYMDAQVPNPVVFGAWNNERIRIDFPLDATGNLDLIIDGQTIKTFDIYQDRLQLYSDDIYRVKNYLEYQLDDLNYTQHTYTLRYYNGNYPDKNVSGSFNVTYMIDVYTYNSYNIKYGDNITFTIRLPSDAENNVSVIANGEPYSIQGEYGNYEFTFSKLIYGENKFFFTYKDSKYPEKTTDYSININSKINWYGEIPYRSDDKNITLLLPSNATGNLTVCTRKYDSSTGEYNYTVIKTIRINDGKASLSISDMDLGSHNLFFRYSGEDYAVDDVDGHVTIIPNITYPTGIWTGSAEKYNVTALLPDTATDKLIITIYNASQNEWDYYFTPTLIFTLYNDTAKSKINLTMPKLDVGRYSLNVLYRTDSKSYYFTVRDSNPDWKMEVNFRSELIIDDEGENYIWYRPKNVPSDADGKLTLYIDGEKVETAQFGYDYDCEWYYSSLSNGNHTWKLEYTGDSYYKDTSINGTFKIISIPVSIEMYDYAYLDDPNDFFAVIHADYDVNGTIIVLINGEEKFNKTLDQLRKDYGDVARFYIGPDNINYNWEVKSYLIEVKYVGGNYDSVTASETVEIMDKNHVNIHIYGTNIDYPNSSFSYLSAPEDARGTVIVLINGEEKLRKSLTELVKDEDDDYIIMLKDVDYKWKAQSYNIEVRYVGGNYESTSRNKTVNMTYNDYEEPSSSEIDLNTYNYAYLDNSTDYFASVSAPQGTTGTITVLIDGKDKFEIPLSQCRVNENGEYIIGPKDINYNWEKQSYNIEVKFTDANNNEISKSKNIEMKNKNGGDTNSNPNTNGAGQGAGSGSTPSNTGGSKTKAKEVVKLTLAKVKVKKSAKKLVIKATLKINGKWAKGKKITFKFNGKKYTAKTNKKGVAKITVKKAILKKLRAGKKITYMATYKGKTVKKIVKVAK